MSTTRERHDRPSRAPGARGPRPATREYPTTAAQPSASARMSASSRSSVSSAASAAPSAPATISFPATMALVSPRVRVHRRGELGNRALMPPSGPWASSGERARLASSNQLPWEADMRIGIIGAGQIGGTLTRRFRALGHEVLVATSRGPGTLADLAAETGATAVPVAEAARSGELVVVTIPQSGRLVPGDPARHPPPLPL